MTPKHVGNGLKLAAMVALVHGAPTARAATCTWTVSGKVQVRESALDPAGLQVDRAIAGARVKISGATVGGLFASWGTVTTRSDGSFSYSTAKTCSDRYLKAELSFADAELEVKNPSGSEYHKLYESSAKRASGTLNIGTVRFTDGSGTTEYNSEDAFRRALAWVLIHSVIDALPAVDPYLAFGRVVHVRYPANVAFSSTSYANGLDYAAYLDPTYIGDHKDFLGTVLHEVMHLWNYNHNHGMTNWLGAVWGDQSTHSDWENANVAFHEGFAEFAQQELLRELWGWARRVPPSTETLTAYGLTSLAAVEHSDLGVRYALRWLVDQDVYPASTLTLSCPAEPTLSIFDVLKVFAANSAAGYPQEWEVGQTDVGVWDFYDRAAAILPSLTSSDTALFMDMLDVTQDADPASRCLTLMRVARF